MVKYQELSVIEVTLIKDPFLRPTLVVAVAEFGDLPLASFLISNNMKAGCGWQLVGMDV